MHNRNAKQFLLCKKNALDVYNSLNDKTYDDPELVEICTLEHGVSLSIKNDASFFVASDLNIYEHQSTYNPNMPLRYLLYLTEIIKPMLKNKDIYGAKLIKIPTPKFVTFYNGVSKRPETEILRLSNSYENKQSEPELELKVTCYNINLGNNKILLEKSLVLNDYMLFVNKIREFRKAENIKDAVDMAIDYCIDNNILKDFFSTRRNEVQKAMILDMTFEAREKLIRRDSYDDGFNDGFNDGISNGLSSVARNMLIKNAPLSDIISYTGLSKEQILAIANNNGLNVNEGL